MNVVVLAAGTSSRMGKINKLLLSANGHTLVDFCCLEALKYLSELNEKSRLIVVTGYRSQAILNFLSESSEFIEKTDSPIQMTVIRNADYRKGQFTSAKTGLSQLPGGEDFFISLADMPQITSENYKILAGELGDFDAVRAVVGDVPGHPVLFSASMRERILSKPDDWSVKKVLQECKVKELPFSDSSWIKDWDTLSDIS